MKARILVASLAVLAASCSSDGDDGAEAVETEQAGEAAETSTADSDSEGEPEGGSETTGDDGLSDDEEDSAAEPVPIVIEPANGATTTATSSAMGGIRFAYPADMTHLSLDDLVLVHPAGAAPNEANVVMHLVSQLASGSAVEDLESYFAALEGTRELVPTGETIDVQGFVLEGFDVSGSGEVAAFANSRFPAPILATGGPAANSRIFVGMTPSGVMTVGYGGLEPESLEAMRPVLGTMLAEFEFTGPGLDPALPPGESIEPSDAGPPPPPLDVLEDAAVPPLGGPFEPASPGRQELVNFGLALSLEFGDNWFIQPNFPGVVVLTEPSSVGPNDRDIVFINSIAEFVPIAGGPIRAGEPVAVDDIDALIDAPPAGVSVSDVERFELSSESGASTSVVGFEISVDDGSACSPTDPCEFGFVTSYGFVKQIRDGDIHRVWWFPDHPNGPGAAVASAAEGTAAWMDEAVALMATLELSR